MSRASLTSQGLVLATAMAVSAGTAVLFDLLRDKYFPPASLQNIPPTHQNQLLKSCLSSGSKKKKKRVKFAEDVKDPKGNGELYRKAGRKRSGEMLHKSWCGDEFHKKIPANHAALYNGILKGRVHRMGCSY